MQFAKYQALGNDYLVVERDDWGNRVSPATVRRICDRHFGIGSDGILVREPSSVPNEFRLRILNPDGSEAEMARYAGVHQHMLVAEGKAIEFYRKCGFERAGQTEPMWIYAGHDH